MTTPPTPTTETPEMTPQQQWDKLSLFDSDRIEADFLRSRQGHNAILDAFTSIPLDALSGDISAAFGPVAHALNEHRKREMQRMAGRNGG